MSLLRVLLFCALFSSLASAQPIPESSCTPQEPDKCFVLGFAYDNAKGVTRDPAKAVFFYEKACNAGNGDACHNLGGLYFEGDGIAQNKAKAAGFYEKACSANRAPSCTLVGFMYQNGDGVTKDNAKVLSFYQKGCDLGNDVACNGLGILYRDGTGTTSDPAKALSLFEKACSAGSKKGCMNAGVLYKDGKEGAVAKDPSKASQLLTKACTREVSLGCYELGLLYQYGQGVKHDLLEAGVLHEMACNGGNPLACNELGFFFEFGLGVPKNAKNAEELYTKSCSAGYAIACRNVEFLVQGGDASIDLDALPPELAKKQLSLYEAGCASGVALSCFEAGRYLRTKGDPKGNTHMEKACNAKHWESCAELGSSYEAGTAVSKSEATAAALYEKACNSGYIVWACGRLGGLYERGVGINKDLNQAQRLYQKVCEAGSKEMCSKADAVAKEIPKNLTPTVPPAQEKPVEDVVTIKIKKIERELSLGVSGFQLTPEESSGSSLGALASVSGNFYRYKKWKSRGVVRLNGAVGLSNNDELWYEARGSLGYSLALGESFRFMPSLGLGIDELQSDTPDGVSVVRAPYRLLDLRLSFKLPYKSSPGKPFRYIMLEGAYSHTTRSVEDPPDEMDRLELSLSGARWTLTLSSSNYRELGRLTALGVSKSF